MFKQIRYTLIFVQNGKKILLGYKKRGYGKGKWNGFGGKVEQDEVMEDCAVRELKEECGLSVKHIDLIELGSIRCRYLDGCLEDFMKVFKVQNYSGDIVESDEMKPKWFSLSCLPFEKMWSMDHLWYPLMINGKQFQVDICFTNGGNLLYCDVSQNNDKNIRRKYSLMYEKQNNKTKHKLRKFSLTFENKPVSVF